MSEESKSVLPQCVADYIDLVVKKMGYRRKVRVEVREELTGHFTDALHGIADEQQRVERAMSLIKEFGDAKTLATLIRRGKKRCRPLWLKALIRCFQAVGIAIILLIAYLAVMFTGRPDIHIDYVAQLNQLGRPAVDESLNGEPCYDKATSLLKPEPNGLPKPWEAELTPERIAAVRQWVVECAPAAEQVHKGNERPFAWRDYSSSDGSMMMVRMPGSVDCRQLTYLMGWTAWLDAQDGKFDKAFDDIKQCYLMGQRAETQRLLVEQLMALAIKAYSAKAARSIIAMPQVKADLLTRFQTEYEDLLAKSDFHLYYEGESMCIKDYVQRTFTRGGRVAPLAMGRLMQWNEETGGLDWDLSTHNTLDVIAVGAHMALTQPDKSTTLRQTADLFDKAQQAASMTPYQAREVKPTLSEVSVRFYGANSLLRHLLPSIEKIANVSWLNRLDCYALIAQIAAERYKRDKGMYPENLEELRKAGYLKELPMDPWSDKPLVYRKTADGYTLYSVGPDFKDDGGNGLDERGKLVSQPSLNGLDCVFWPLTNDKGRGSSK